MIAIELFRLFGSIFIDNEEANKSISKTEEKAESLGTKLGKGIKTAAKWGTAIVGGASAAVGGLLAVTNKTAEYADEIDKMAERTNIGRERLQELRYAASQSDVEFSVLEKAVKKMSETSVLAADGSKKAAEAFEMLGISLTNTDGSMKSVNQLFEESMNALADMEESVERNYIGNQIFGRGFTEMLPLLNAGSDGIQELSDRARELGLVMSEDAVVANVVFGDTMADLKDSFGALVRDFTNGMLPMFQEFINFILANMPMIQETVGGVFSALGNAVLGVLPFLMDLIQNALPPMIDLFSKIASDILPPVITLFTDILQTVLPPLISLFSGIITTILPPLIDLLTVVIEDILPPFIDLFNDILSTVLPPLMDLFKQIIDTLLPPLIDLFEQIIDAIMPFLIELFNQFTETVLPPLMELINEIVQVILPPLLDLFNDLAQVVLPLVMEVFEALQPVIEPAMKAIAAIIKTVLALIKGDWEGAWNGIKEFFSNALDYYINIAKGFKDTFIAVFKAIKDSVTAIWDSLVNGIKSGINFIISGINAFIKGVNSIKIPDWVPGVGGKGINIPTIPMLANGGEIIKGGAAIVGERGPELINLPTGAKVTPLQGAETTVNVYTMLDGKVVAKSTSRIQAQRNNSKSRALGVVPAW